MYLAFNTEEYDLAGSREFVNEMAGEMKLLEQVHVLEMVGYRDRRPNSQKNPLPMIQAPSTGDFLAVVARITVGGNSADFPAFAAQRPCSVLGKRHTSSHVDGYLGVPQPELPPGDRHAGHAGLRVHGGSGEVADGGSG